MDRLSLTEADAAATKAATAAQREPPRNFYGWAVVTAGKVAYAGCEVEASPLPENLYHADIVLPDSVVEDADDQLQYAVALAGMAEWQPYPQR